MTVGRTERAAGFHAFTWGGAPIADIEQWAADRQEEMVEYLATRHVLGSDYRDPITEVDEGAMPASFFDTLLLGPDGWQFREVCRRAPRRGSR